MAIAFRAAATGTVDGGASLVVAKPTGTDEGDVLVAVVGWDRAEYSMTLPAGWTLVRSDESGGEQAIAYKVAGAAEPSSYSFTFSTSVDASAAVLAYTGVDTAAPVDVSGGGVGSSSAITAPSVTTTNANCRVLAALGLRDGGTTVGTPSGTTSRAAIEPESDVRWSMRVVDFDQVTVGATGDKTASSGGSAYWVGQQVALNEANIAPDAPTNLSPEGATVNKDATQRFSWSFSDPNFGDSQSKYDLRWRLNDGVSAWTTVTASTPNTYHDFPAGTFAAGDYEWQVRTYDSQGEVGPYSASAFFTAAAVPNTPTITDPINNGTVDADPYTVAWSTPDQDAYQLRTVADIAGSPDTATVYSDTGTVTSTTARSRSVAFPVNGRVEHIQVRTQNDGLWSNWASVKVTVSYAAPAVPTIAVEADNPTGAISMQATHPAPTGSQPAVTSVDWWRQEIGDDDNPTAEPIALARGAGQPSSGTFTDWQIGSDRRYRYRARAVGANGTSSWSDWTLGEDVDTPGAVLPATLPFVLG